MLKRFSVESLVANETGTRPKWQSRRRGLDTDVSADARKEEDA
jgi:hypothetical protein